MYDTDWARLVVLDLWKSNTRVELFAKSAYKAWRSKDIARQGVLWDGMDTFPKSVVIENLAYMLAMSHHDMKLRNLWNYMKKKIESSDWFLSAEDLDSLCPCLFRNCYKV